MKKRITCLLAVLIVLVSVVPAGAVDITWFGSSWYEGFTDALNNSFIAWKVNPNMTSIYYVSSSDALRCDMTIDTAEDRDVYIFSGFSSDWKVMQTSGYNTDLYDAFKLNYSKKYDLSLNQPLAWSMTIPVYIDNSFAGYLWPNPDGKIDESVWELHGGIYQPSYDLENDWLSQTTECGAYIIAPKSGKVWTSNDTKVNITVQYRIPSIDLGGGGSLGVNVLWYGVDSGGLPQGIAEWFTGPLDELSHDQKLEYDSGGIPRYMTGTVVFSGTMRKNMSVECYATVNGTEHDEYVGKIYETNHIAMTHYDNFIDEDGDGKDDRDPDPDYNPGGTTDNNTDVGSFENILDALNSTKSTINGFISFLANFFRFIPIQIFALIGVGMALVIVLRLWGR